MEFKLNDIVLVRPPEMNVATNANFLLSHLANSLVENSSISYDTLFELIAGLTAFVGGSLALTLSRISLGSHSPRVSATITVDFDTFVFLFAYFPMILILNVGHTYIMYTWSNQWAEMSFMLLAVSAVHYLQSFASFLLVYDNGWFMYKLKDLRILSLGLAQTTVCLWALLFLVEIFLLFYSQDLLSIGVGLLVAYFLLVTSTDLPGVLVTLVKEQTLTLMERSDIYSVPGEYFSLFEFGCEYLGFYGDDVRLHSYIQKQVAAILDGTGFTKLAMKTKWLGYIDSYLRKQFDPQVQLGDWISTTWGLLAAETAQAASALQSDA